SRAPRVPASADRTTAGSGLWPPGPRDRGRTGGALCAGARLSPGGGVPTARGGQCDATGGASGGHSLHTPWTRAAGESGRDSRAGPAGTRLTARFGASVDGGQRVGRSRSGADLCPGPGVVHTGGGDPAALLNAARLMAILSQPGRFADGSGAGRRTVPPGT